MPDVVVVANDQASGRRLMDVIENNGESVILADDVADAIRLCRLQKPDWVVADLRSNAGSVFDLMLRLPSTVRCRFAVIAPKTTVDEFSERGGSRVHWLTDDRLDQELVDIMKQTRRSRKFRQKKKNKNKRSSFGPLLGNCPAMRRLYEMVAKAAPTDATILLVGESGTGKELVAREAHDRSLRKAKPYVAVNCGAIPQNLIESELFGHEKGAFTGATRSRKGVFEQADGGTLFLDEVAEMPIDLQVKLLRVLEDGMVTRVGGEKEIHVDVRVVAATNRRPSEAVTHGTLREDLLYRLSVFPIALPPLRERGGDVVLLARYFTDQFNRETGTSKNLGPDGAARLQRYHWPGNVRQLRNLIKRAHIMADADIDMEELDSLIAGTNSVFSSPLQKPEPSRSGPERPEACIHLDVPAGTTLAAAEEKLILATLHQCNGDKRRASEQLGVSLKTIYNRLRQYEEAGLPDPSEEVLAETLLVP